jgi:hypothetical protein
MARFSNTKRNEYTSEKVRSMRSERKNKKAVVTGVSDQNYQLCLGELIGAGHLKIEGFEKMEMQSEADTWANAISRTISFKHYTLNDGRGESAHVKGYLSSGHPSDPKFKIKGWFNEDGTIRLELVK